MIEKEVQVLNRAGLHTRPAAKLVTLTSKYKSEIFLSRDGFRINAKSIIGVMTLAAEKGCKLTLSTEGEDESEAAAELAEYFADAFGEKR